MLRILTVIVVASVLAAGFFLLRSGDDLVIYSGRSKALVDPLVDRFEAQTGLQVGVRYGGTSQLAVALLEEGTRSPADIFWAQDAGALGAVHEAGLLQTLPSDLTKGQPEKFRNSSGTWIATSGRARVLAYSQPRVNAASLPASVFELTEARFRNRVGWAPTNGSFQSFVTAMQKTQGETRTRQWLLEMKENGAKNYNNNNALVEAIAAGEIDFAITNHYYLLRFKKTDSDYPVDQAFFESGDPGNLVNVAGAGILTSSERNDAAEDFLAFLLTEDSQRFFLEELSEYPVIDGVSDNPRLLRLEELSQISPEVDLDELRDLEGTLRLLREVGLL